MRRISCRAGRPTSYILERIKKNTLKRKFRIQYVRVKLIIDSLRFRRLLQPSSPTRLRRLPAFCFGWIIDLNRIAGLWIGDDSAARNDELHAIYDRHLESSDIAFGEH